MLSGVWWAPLGTPPPYPAVPDPLRLDVSDRRVRSQLLRVERRRARRIRRHGTGWTYLGSTAQGWLDEARLFEEIPAVLP